MVVTDPDILKQIMLNEFPNFRNRADVSPELDLLHPLHLNILAAKDENWRRIRCTLTPTFSTAKLRQLAELMEEAADTLENKVEDVANTGMVHTFCIRTSKFWPRLVVLAFLHNLSLGCSSIVLVSIMSIIHFCSVKESY